MLTRPNLPDKRMLRIAALPGLLLALCACFGFCLIAYDRVPYASPLLWAAALGLTLVCTLLFCALWLALAKAEALLERVKPRFSGLFGRQWLLWLLILLCWTPCWLAVFPGNFAYDTGGEYDQCAFGFSRAYPRLHSWLNIEIINRYHGVLRFDERGFQRYRTVIHVRGNYIVGVISSGCGFCKTSCLKMSEIVSNNQLDTNKILYFVWGDSASVQPFQEETKTESFRYVRVSPIAAIRVVNGQFPTYLFIRNGEVEATADLRHLTEKAVREHLQ